ncbi:hypothetical protein Tco_1429470 [Tanacetum coccineum]
MFTKQSILGKPPSSSSGSKLYSVTPFPKSSVLPKVDKTNALSKPVTSNSAPSTRESKVVQTVNVIAPRIFRPNPSKTYRVDNVIPNKSVKTSVKIKPITISQPNVIHKQQANSDSNGFSSTRVNNTAKTRRPHPRSNSNTDRVPSMSKITANHDVCVLNYANNMNSRADNQSANVSICENQKKHKANAKKSKELGTKGSLASSRPSKPRNYETVTTIDSQEPLPQTTPPNDDYVAPATKSILEELLEEFGDKILNIAMINKEADPTKDLEELERLLAMRPQSNFTKIRVHSVIINTEPFIHTQLMSPLCGVFKTSKPCKVDRDITSLRRYGYIRNHKKTVKNEQARTQESEEYKKKPKNQSRSQKSQALVKFSQR